MKKLFILAFVLFMASLANAQIASRQWGNDNVQTVTGTITDNQRPSVSLKTSDGTEYVVHLGPVWFWNQSKYMLSLADATIKGNVKILDGKNHLYPFTIEQNGTKMVIADDNGVPKWSNGNGWGKGNGRGYGKGGCWRNNSNNGCGYNCGNCPNYNNCVNCGKGNGNGNDNGNGNGYGRGNCWRNN
ncbi:MAG: hypothetical protein LWX07_00065 [Bacteroidetes bacterium]|nr:hypothetical protein [Bacteroidota bacterium]